MLQASPVGIGDREVGVGSPYALLATIQDRPQNCRQAEHIVYHLAWTNKQAPVALSRHAYLRPRIYPLFI